MGSGVAVGVCVAGSSVGVDVEVGTLELVGSGVGVIVEESEDEQDDRKKNSVIKRLIARR